jgi:MFS family permease
MNLRPRLPEVLKHRDYRWYLIGVVISQIGTHGTLVVMLYHMYDLTGSTLQVGLVGAAQGIAIFLLSPIGGYFADRLDRKTLLQVAQAVSMLASLAVALVTLAGAVEPWHILVAVFVNTAAAAAFDRPVRRAILPALLPPEDLVAGAALMNPFAEISKLVGPALGGLFIGIGGPGLMYSVDAVSFLALIVIVAFLRIPHVQPEPSAMTFVSSISEGARFVKDRPLILHLLGLDLSAMIFAAYRVVLPALTVEVLDVGPAGYGLLAAAPPVGALVGGVVVYRLVALSSPAGRLIVAGTTGYGVSAVLLAQSDSLAMAFAAAAGLGVCDAVCTTLRHAGVLLATPDRLMGRVSALYSMSAQGGPALGDLQMGWLSGVLGASPALTLGGIVTVLYATAVGVWAKTVREFRTGDQRAT